MEIVQTRAPNPNATSLVTGDAILQSMLLISSALAGGLNTQMEHEIQRPPGIAITSSINADDLFSITLGNAPNTCMCQEPACDFYRTNGELRHGEVQDYGSNTTARCNFYSISGAITAVSGGTTCYTFRADYKSCTVYPADAFLSSFTTSPGAGECSRLNGASCTMRRSNELAGQWYDYKTLTTLTASVDRTCDTLPWQPCTESSHCCGAVDGWSCQLTSCPHILPSGECARTQPGSEADRTVAGSETRMCQPPHGGPDFDSRGPDERLFVSWGAKGIDDFNTEAKTRTGGDVTQF